MTDEPTKRRRRRSKDSAKGYEAPPDKPKRNGERNGEVNGEGNKINGQKTRIEAGEGKGECRTDRPADSDTELSSETDKGFDIPTVSERDSKGRFAPGGPGGPGRPRGAKELDSEGGGGQAPPVDLLAAFDKAIEQYGAERFWRDLLAKSPASAGQLLACLKKMEGAGPSTSEPVNIIMPANSPVAALLDDAADRPAVEGDAAPVEPVEEVAEWDDFGPDALPASDAPSDAEPSDAEPDLEAWLRSKATSGGSGYATCIDLDSDRGGGWQQHGSVDEAFAALHGDSEDGGSLW